MKKLIAIFLVFTQQAFAQDRDVADFYYIQFGVETFIATTPSNIKNKSFDRGKLSPQETSELLHLIESGKVVDAKKFEKGRVRLLLEVFHNRTEEIPDRTVVIDNEGAVLVDKTVSLLSNDAFDKIKKFFSVKLVNNDRDDDRKN